MAGMIDGSGLHLVYFVHDLNDPAVARRVAMLRAGGLDVVVAGFWRGRRPSAEICGARAVAIGRTYDSRLVHRAITTMRHATIDRGFVNALGAAEVFLARNLEMLAIAVAARSTNSARPALVYEVLDIHRLLLGRGVLAATLRRVEHTLMKHVQLLIVSSPAYLRVYFEPVHVVRRRISSVIVENKPFGREPAPVMEQQPDCAPGPPWRIGWFGMIRCRRSLEILGRLAQKRPDLLSLTIAGRCTKAVAPRLEELLASSKASSFRGAYAPGDLASLYGSVHFNWTVDYFEENGNSEWLLPNRLYEGGACASIPFALARTETGRWLNERKLGVQLNDPAVELESFLEHLTAKRYRDLKDAALAAPRSWFVAGQADCDRLVTVLADASVREPHSAQLPSPAGVT